MWNVLCLKLGLFSRLFGSYRRIIVLITVWNGRGSLTDKRAMNFPPNRSPSTKKKNRGTGFTTYTVFVYFTYNLIVRCRRRSLLTTLRPFVCDLLFLLSRANTDFLYHHHHPSFVRPTKPGLTDKTIGDKRRLQRRAPS